MANRFMVSESLAVHLVENSASALAASAFDVSKEGAISGLLAPESLIAILKSLWYNHFGKDAKAYGGFGIWDSATEPNRHSLCKDGACDDEYIFSQTGFELFEKFSLNHRTVPP